MQEAPIDWPVLHIRIKAADPDARENVASAALRYLSPILLGKFRGVDPAVVSSAIEDAVMAYLRVPAQFDESRASLPRYLAVAAERRLIDSLRRERTRRGYEQTVALERVAASTQTLWHRPSLLSVVRLISSRTDRRFFVARLKGKELGALAQILGLERGSIMEKKRAVKNADDRIRVRLKRVALKQWRAYIN